MLALMRVHSAAEYLIIYQRDICSSGAFKKKKNSDGWVLRGIYLQDPLSGLFLSSTHFRLSPFSEQMHLTNCQDGNKANFSEAFGGVLTLVCQHKVLACLFQ